MLVHPQVESWLLGRGEIGWTQIHGALEDEFVHSVAEELCASSVYRGS